MRSVPAKPDTDRPIGVFDSGLGGLTVVREFTALMPAEDILYLGDSARVPYGIKSLETVRRFAAEDARFLLAFAPKLLVVACNTASAAGLEQVRTAARDHSAQGAIDVVDVIAPGAAAAVELTDGPIGVIGTEATVRSGAYQRAIDALAPGREVLAVPAPLLVPIVEEGRDEDDPIVLHVLGDYLRTLQRRRPGALILGCTHYPLLSGAIRKLMGPGVPLVSSARAAAVEVRARLERSGLRTSGDAPGRLACYTTDNAERFAALGERFGGRRIDHVEFVGTDELETHPQPA